MDENGGLADKHKAGLSLLRIPFLKTDYIGLLVDKKQSTFAPFLDVRVRQALSVSIYRIGISRNLRRNSVLPSDKFVPPSLPGRRSLIHYREDLNTAGDCPVNSSKTT